MKSTLIIGDVSRFLWTYFVILNLQYLQFSQGLCLCEYNCVYPADVSRLDAAERYLHKHKRLSRGSTALWVCVHHLISSISVSQDDRKLVSVDVHTCRAFTQHHSLLPAQLLRLTLPSAMAGSHLHRGRSLPCRSHPGALCLCRHQ